MKGRILRMSCFRHSVIKSPATATIRSCVDFERVLFRTVCKPRNAIRFFTFRNSNRGSSMRFVGISKALGLLTGSALLAVAAFGLPQAASAPADKSVPVAQAKSTTSASSSDGSSTDIPSDYVGAEVCKTCHEDIYNGWEKSPHWKTTLDTKGSRLIKDARVVTVPDRLTWREAVTSPRSSSLKIARRRKLTPAV